MPTREEEHTLLPPDCQPGTVTLLVLNDLGKDPEEQQVGSELVYNGRQPVCPDSRPWSKAH